MSLTSMLYKLDVPPVGTVTLPGTANAKFSTIFGWGLAAVGIIAVLAMFAAGAAFMAAKENRQSTDGPERVLKICAGVIVAVVGSAVVNVMMA